MITAQMNGTRLAFVVVPQEGSVRRPVHKFDKKGGGLQVKDVEEPAGFLVYFPRGHTIRIRTRKELVHYGLHKDPPIINLRGLHDRNSPIGKLMMSQDEASRRSAFASLEQQVIQLAQAKSGKIELCRDWNDLVSDDEKETA